MVDNTYKQIVEQVLSKGYLYDDPNREGVKRLEIPSYTFRHEFKDGFPAITLKKLAFKSVTTELIWFLKGDTNIKYLIDNGCSIWNKDAYNYYSKRFLEKHPSFKQNLFSLEEFISVIKSRPLNELHNIQNIGKDYTLGDLGKVYGHYWRNFNGVDQIKELIHDMINKPMSSELLVVARNPADKEVQALPCCHYGFQIVMRPLSEMDISTMIEEKLLHYYHLSFEYHEGIREEIYNELPKYGFELHWKQRSCDLFLGIPFNIASYAELALILEKITGHKALAIQGDLKKVHLYDNSIEEAKELIKRESSEDKVNLLVDNVFDIDIKKYSKNLDMLFSRMTPKDFSLENYNPQPTIKVEMLERR